MILDDNFLSAHVEEMKNYFDSNMKDLYESNIGTTMIDVASLW